MPPSKVCCAGDDVHVRRLVILLLVHPFAEREHRHHLPAAAAEKHAGCGEVILFATSATDAVD